MKIMQKFSGLMHCSFFPECSSKSEIQYEKYDLWRRAHPSRQMFYKCFCVVYKFLFKFILVLF